MKLIENFLFIFLVITQAQAMDDDCHGHNLTHAELDQLENVSKHLDWEAASDLEIKNAHCLRKNPITESEIVEWLKANQSASVLSKKINGIQFENETPENLRAFEFLTTAQDFFGKTDASLQKTFSSSCKKVDCAVKEIFGKSEGMQLLYMHRKYGLNGSHLVKKNTSSWKRTELDTILLALTDYPDGILPFQENRPLAHFERGYMRPGGEYTIANAVIEIFDLWDRQSPEKKRYTLTHELGHALAGVTNIDDHKKWKDLSGWSETTKMVNGKPVRESKASDKHSIISKYGETNQAEDFAESVAAYRYQPKRLIDANPKKYNLIKEFIFDNVEYTSESACSNPKRMSRDYKERMQKTVNEWTPSQDELILASKKCSETAIVKLSSEGSINLKDPEMLNCYESALNQQAKELGMKILDSNPDKEFIAPLFRNVKLEAIPTDKLQKMVNNTMEIHRTNLKNDFTNALKKSYFFVNNSSRDKLGYIYQSFDKNMGFDPYSRKNEFTNIADKMTKQISASKSLRRTLNLDFSESEISDQVELMIR